MLDVNLLGVTSATIFVLGQDMKKILGVALLGALVVGPAQAQYTSTLCDGATWGGAGDEVCVMAQFTLTNGNSTLNMYLFNGATATTALIGSRITEVAVAWPGPGAFPGISDFNAAYYNNGVLSVADVATWTSSGFYFAANLEAGTTQAGGNGGGISTCTTPGAGGGTLYQTCDRPDATAFGAGWDYMHFVWNLNAPMDPTKLGDIQWAWRALSVGDGEDSYECATDASFKGEDKVCRLDPDTPQEVVPEPATMTLLATGLAGMAAARRRRKNNA